MALQQTSDGSNVSGPRRPGAPRRTYNRAMTVLVDHPMWPAHGTLWAHLVSDSSLDELHAFAERVGLPARSFDNDHYDVPAARIDELVRQGAVQVSGRELLRRLELGGLRVRQRDKGPRGIRPGT